MVRKIWDNYFWWIVGVAILVYAIIFIAIDAWNMPSHAASQKDMRLLRGLVIQHHAGDSDQMQVVATDDGYTYIVTYEQKKTGHKLTVARTGDTIGHISILPDGRMTRDVVQLTTVFVDENADGLVDNVIEKASADRYWADLNKWKGKEQSEYDRVIRTLLRLLDRTAPI